MSCTRDWTDQQIKYYYLGIKYGDYPRVFWDKMKPRIAGCRTLIDIGCGPGAFALKAASEGFNVQAVDINKKNLAALKQQIGLLRLKNIAIIYGDWLEVEVKKSDVAVCAYSFGGNIGTRAGIKKIIDVTGEVAFLISPCEKVQTAFLSRELYLKSGIAPPSFSGDHRDILQVFKELKEVVEWEVVEYDFGIPLKNKDEINSCAVYLSEKLGLPSIQSLEKHIENHITIRDGMYWLPNPKKSAIITWKRRNEDE